MITLYRVTQWQNTIESEDFERVTEKFAFRKEQTYRGLVERRMALISASYHYYSTRQEAVDSLRSSLKSSIKSHEYQLAKDRAALERLK